MIIAPDWIWVHVPKCAGTETEAILQSVYARDRSVVFDPVGPGLPVIWHQTLAKRAAEDPGFSPGGRRVIGNIRRLPAWILSRVHFEIARSGPEAGVTRKQLVLGKYRTGAPTAAQEKAPNSRLSSADQALRGYLAEVTDWVRTEELAEDLQRVFGWTAAPPRPPEAKANKNRIPYVRDPAFWFSRRDLARMYAANPLWAALELRLYGDLLTVAA
jgi:hypothetical protein